MIKYNDDYHRKKREWQRQNKERMDAYRKERKEGLKNGTYKRKNKSIYIKPKMNVCSCGKLTPNHFGRCSSCLEEMEIPGDCLGWEVTGLHLYG